MFKVYKKADILEKISDRVKMVDDLYHLPPDLFDRELFDYWYSVYLDYYQDCGYDDFDFDLRDIRLFYYAFYLMECRGCCNLVLIEFGDMIYFIFDPSGFATLESKFRNEREELLRKVSDLTVWVLKTHYTHYTRLMSICQYCLPEKAAGTVKLRFLSPKGV